MRCHWMALLAIGLLQSSGQPSSTHVFLIDSELTSSNVYLTAIDASGNVIQRTPVPDRWRGFGMESDYQYLVAPLGDPARFQRIGTDGTSHGYFHDGNPPTFAAIDWYALDDSRNLYTRGNGGSGLRKLNADGSIAWNVATNNPTGMATHGSHTVYVAVDDSSFSPQIKKYSSDGTLLGAFPISYHFGGAMDIDEAGGILYLGNQPGTVAAFDISGGGVEFLRSFPSQLGAVFDISVDHFSGNIIVTGLGGLVELSPVGNEIVRFPAGAITGAIPANEISRDADFDSNRRLDTGDLDELSRAIATGVAPLIFDISHDGVVDERDITEWLSDAGRIRNASGSPFLIGDADLDGVVDGHDFGIWNANKYSTNASWSRGDFNANGIVDGDDFQMWNSNKFRSVDSRLVPEPIVALLGYLVGGMVMCRRKRKGSP